MKQRTSLESLKYKQAFLKALVFFFVTVVVWIGFTLFRSQSTTKLPEDLTRLSEPLNPNIDIAVVDRIEKKRDPLANIPSPLPSSAPSPLPEALPAPIPSAAPVVPDVGGE